LAGTSFLSLPDDQNLPWPGKIASLHSLMSLSVDPIPEINRGKPFVQILIQLLEWAGDDREKGARVGLCWVGGSSKRFFSNAAMIAQILGLQRNSICLNFREFGIEKEKKEKNAKSPKGLPNSRQWKVRYHPLLMPGVDEHLGAQFRRKVPSLTSNESGRGENPENEPFPALGQSPVDRKEENIDELERFRQELLSNSNEELISDQHDIFSFGERDVDFCAAQRNEEGGQEGEGSTDARHRLRLLGG
jgi:hypothetical protein